MISFQEQMTIIKIAQSVTGALSVIGSLTVIYIILTGKNKLSSAYRRIVFGMSICDIVGSFAFSLSYIPRAGHAVCDAQGFFIHFGISSTPIYNLSLSIYYVLTVFFEKKEDWIRTRAEAFLHGMPILWSLGSAIYLVATKSINENGANCWIAAEPSKCLYSPDIACERGANAIKFRWIFGFYQTIIVFVLIVGSMMMLVYKVKRQERVMNERFSIKPINQRERSSLRSTLRSTLSLKRQDSVRSNTSASKREVTKQAFIYVAAYFLPFFFPLFFFVNNFVTGKFNFTLMVLVSLFMPLQGVFNCMVFVRPKIIALRKKDSNLSFFGAFMKIICGNMDSRNLSTLSSKTARSSGTKYGLSISTHTRVKSVSIKIPEEVHIEDDVEEQSSK